MTRGGLLAWAVLLAWLGAPAVWQWLKRRAHNRVSAIRRQMEKQRS